MNKVRGEARPFAAEFLPLVAAVKRVEVLLCPPFTCLDVMQSALAESGVALGAQNLYWEAQGPLPGRFPLKCWLIAGVSMLLSAIPSGVTSWGRTTS